MAKLGSADRTVGPVTVSCLSLHVAVDFLAAARSTARPLQTLGAAAVIFHEPYARINVRSTP